MRILRLKEQEESKISEDADINELIANSKESTISFICYDANNYEEKELKSIDKLKDYITPNRVNWVNIIGTQDLELIKNLGNQFNLHPLIVEDIHTTNQRLKIDQFPEYLFIVLKAISYLKGEVLELEQVSIIFSENFVFTFQESKSNQFTQIRERIKQSRGRIRKSGADYLVYVLLDVLVDNYFTILEDFGERLDELHESLVQNPTPEILQEIYEFKKE
ncbi:MAG: magnesium and cobalt transport protein CorA, partial [Asgard group archaeon]|nr:magnesium and cobalt transport protein CorA [Asgard group archaeon]